MTYGCYNNVRPVTGSITHYAQAGWNFYGPFHEHCRPNFIPIRHAMSTTCQYDLSAADPGCAGCKHSTKE